MNLTHLTPYDDNYPSCLETHCTLRIYSGDVAPNELTKKLQIQPTETLEKGRIRSNTLGRVRRDKFNAWFLESSNFVSSLDLRRHLDWLLLQLRPRRDAIRYLQTVAHVRMGITCAWYSRSGHGGPTLWPEQMAALADLNIECGFDIMFIDAD